MELTNLRLIVVILLLLSPILLIRARLFAYGYLGLLFFMPQTLSFGVKKGVEYLAFYGIGTGIFVRPLISILLLALFAISAFLYRKNLIAFKYSQTIKILLVLSLYYLLYASWGVASGVPLGKIISGHSAVHLVDMSLLILILFRFCYSEKDFSRLSVFMIACVATREVYGLVRFLFWGGDFSNVYSNVEGINVKLTFQDINDSLLACLVGFYCGWNVMHNWLKTSLETKVFYLFMVVLSTFTVMFSFRRSAWIGLCLAGVWFVVRQPRGRRVKVGIIGLVVLVFTFSTLLTMRLGHYENRKTSLLLYDITSEAGEITTETGRLSEIAIAVDTIKDNILFGIGPWGTIGRLGNRDYIHGGVMQIWLKLGLPGLAMFLAAILSFMFFCLQRSREIPPEIRGWFEAGFAGFLFMVPTLCVGTPIVEYRTTQLIALCLALPYVSYAVFLRQQKTRVTTPV